MSREPYEDDLLEEATTLEDLIGIFSRLEDYLGRLQHTHHDVLDDELLAFLAIIQVDIGFLVGAKRVKFTAEGKARKVQGLIAQYEEVMENISATQAGLPTKHGVKDEDDDEED